MLSTFFGLFLIAHALAHAGLAAAPIPDDPNSTPGAFFTDVNRSWLFLKIGFRGCTVDWHHAGRFFNYRIYHCWLGCFGRSCV